MTASLLRLSQLARFWGKNARTIQTWIRQGRLAAIRSPGNHFRVRVADVRAFCERERMPVPPFVSPPPRRVVAAGLSAPAQRAMARAVRGPGLALETYDDPYDALLAASRETVLLAIPARCRGFDPGSAIAAMRRCDATGRATIVAFGAATRAQAASLARAGATRVLTRAQEDHLPRVVRELLGVEEGANAIEQNVGQRDLRHRG
jgi:excisionase family DNA binding protein